MGAGAVVGAVVGGSVVGGAVVGGAVVGGCPASVGEIVTRIISEDGFVRMTRRGAVSIDADARVVIPGVTFADSPNHGEEVDDLADPGVVMKNFSCPLMLTVTGPMSVTRSTSFVGLVTVDIVTGPMDPNSFWK